MIRFPLVLFLLLLFTACTQPNQNIATTPIETSPLTSIVAATDTPHQVNTQWPKDISEPPDNQTPINEWWESVDLQETLEASKPLPPRVGEVRFISLASPLPPSLPEPSKWIFWELRPWWDPRRWDGGGIAVYLFDSIAEADEVFNATRKNFSVTHIPTGGKSSLVIVSIDVTFADEAFMQVEKFTSPVLAKDSSIYSTVIGRTLFFRQCHAFVSVDLGYEVFTANPYGHISIDGATYEEFMEYLGRLRAVIGDVACINDK